MTDRPTGLDLVTDCVAAWRLTHLIVEDHFPPVERARDKLLRRLGPEHPGSYLVTCTFCMGVWVGAAVTVARLVAPRAWRPVAWALTAAAAAPIGERVVS